MMDNIRWADRSGWVARLSREQFARIFDVDPCALCLPLSIDEQPLDPEQDVVDEIDELVNESLARNHRDDYNDPYSERCDVCGGEWHALTGTAPRGPGKMGCPGVFANDEAREAFKSGESNDSPRGLDRSCAEIDVISVNPHALQPVSRSRNSMTIW